MHLRSFTSVGLTTLALVAGACSPAPSATPGATSSATPAPTSTATPTPSASATPGQSAATGFTCTYPGHLSASAAGTVFIGDVRTGTHDGYDRIVFDLTGAVSPTVDLTVATPPFTRDPSDLPVEVPGSSFVRIRLDATGSGMSTPDGKPTYTGPTSFQLGYPKLTAFEQLGDYEAVSTWIAGLTGSACYRVFTLSSPTRLVIDFQS